MGDCKKLEVKERFNFQFEKIVSLKKSQKNKIISYYRSCKIFVLVSR